MLTQKKKSDYQTVFFSYTRYVRLVLKNIIEIDSVIITIIINKKKSDEPSKCTFIFFPLVHRESRKRFFSERLKNNICHKIYMYLILFYDRFSIISIRVIDDYKCSFIF